MCGFFRPAALLYAVVKSCLACAATPSAACIEPSTTFPGGNPTTAEPGLTPRSPVTMVGPPFVTVEPASTANLAADPRGTRFIAGSTAPPIRPIVMCT